MRMPNRPRQDRSPSRSVSHLIAIVFASAGPAALMPAPACPATRHAPTRTSPGAREKLGLNRVPAGVSPKHKDAIIYDIGDDGKSASGFGQRTCGGKEVEVAKQIGAGLAHSQER